MKNIQISYELFMKLLKYHLEGADEFEEEIKTELEKKMAAVGDHERYSKYKNASIDPEREKAKQEYLKNRRVSNDLSR